MYFKDHQHEIQLSEIQYESDNIETYSIKPSPRYNIHKGVPTYITERSYQTQNVPKAANCRRLTRDGRPVPTLELTFQTSTDQLEDLKLKQSLGRLQSKKLILTSSEAIKCTTCLQVKPKKNSTQYILNCSYCAERGHIRSLCPQLKNLDLRLLCRRSWSNQLPDPTTH
jgi:hypothetical protein